LLEAQGYRVHTTTSPHLVRYNERIRVAGELIGDARLAELLAEVFDAGEGLEPSFFEVTIAAAFSEFARVPADACVVGPARSEEHTSELQSLLRSSYAVF